MRILVDMDGPLVDFDAGMERLSPGYVERRAKEPEVWEGHGFAGLADQDAFFGLLADAGEQWWMNLPKQPWTDELLRLILRVTTDWWIVSSPARCSSSYVGKRWWVEKHYEHYLSRLVLIKDKHLMANPKTLLIDDRQENVDRFREEGGQAILFPHYGNSEWQQRNDPLPYVRSFIH